MNNTAILIPAYKPDDKLTRLTHALKDDGFDKIFVVDDGSGADFRPIFDALEAVTVRHAVNLGKGRAIKTGINAILNAFPEISGIVTADADGQHTPADIRRIAKTMTSHPGTLVLGVRRFTGKVPLRSKFGNLLTRYVFLLFAGTMISDTQTGLRGIPAGALPRFLAISGERYEYEMNMLISASEKRLPILQIPIETVYLDGNTSSHFNPLLDSMKIYFVMIRFSLSSILAFLLDSLVFAAVFYSGGSIGFSTFLARLISGNFNFFLNRRMVFRAGSGFLPFVKYWLLVLFLGSLAYLMIEGLYRFTQINVVVVKIFVEGVLFVLSFLLQRFWIFGLSSERE